MVRHIAYLYFSVIFVAFVQPLLQERRDASESLRGAGWQGNDLRSSSRQTYPDINNFDHFSESFWPSYDTT